MTGDVMRRTDLTEPEKVFLEASYFGERCLVKRKDGVSLAIIPNEDLETLEEVDRTIR